MKNLYSVYDSVANFWQAPCLANTDGEAVRGFITSCSDPRVPARFLSDISLYRIGEFDEINGAIFNTEKRLLIHGNDYVILKYRDSDAKYVMEDVENDSWSEKEEN